MHNSHRQHFQTLLSEYDIADVAGVDLLRLVRTLSNIYEVIVTNHLRKANISGPRWRMLLLLYMAELDGESTGRKTALSPSEISRIQNVTKNTISSLLRSLEDQGLIERRLDQADRRAFQIQLSEAGRELIRTSTPAHVAYLNTLASDLTPEEITQLRSLLLKLHRSLIHYGNLPSTYCID